MALTLAPGTLLFTDNGAVARPARARAWVPRAITTAADALLLATSAIATAAPWTLVYLLTLEPTLLACSLKRWSACGST